MHRGNSSNSSLPYNRSGADRSKSKGNPGGGSVLPRGFLCTLVCYGLVVVLVLGGAATAWSRSFGAVMAKLDATLAAQSASHELGRKLLAKQAEMVANMARVEAESASLLESHIGADIRKVQVGLNDVQAREDLQATQDKSMKAEMGSIKHSIENMVRGAATRGKRDAASSKSGLKPIEDNLDVVSRQLDTLAQLAAMIRKVSVAQAESKAAMAQSSAAHATALQQAAATLSSLHADNVASVAQIRQLRNDVDTIKRSTQATTTAAAAGQPPPAAVAAVAAAVATPSAAGLAGSGTMAGLQQRMEEAKRANLEIVAAAAAAAAAAASKSSPRGGVQQLDSRIQRGPPKAA